MPYSFDDWAGLARRDAQAFEDRRAAVIAEFIDSQPPARRERLRRLQWRIDRERERCGTPLAACIRLSRMMWDQVAGEGGLQDGLRDLLEGRSPADRERPSARVLSFRRRN